MEKGVAELGPQEVMRRTGKSAEELAVVVGEQSEAATKLRNAANDAAVAMPPQRDPAAGTGSGGVAPTAEARKVAAAAQKVFERWNNLSPLQRLEELLATVNARLKEIGAPTARGRHQGGRRRRAS